MPTDAGWGTPGVVAWKGLLGKAWPYLLLLAISLPALTLRLGVSPPIWYDEGYRTNAARTLAESGVYGTYTVAGYEPFDPGMSSGPTEIAAIALSFKLFGLGVAQARSVSVLFTLLALVSLYGIATYLYGRRAALFIMAFVLATPPIQRVSLLLVGRQVLSEAPSLAMVVLGLWLWFRSWDHQQWFLPLLAGLAFGSGLLSKTQAVVALLPALFLVAWLRWVRRDARPIRALTPAVMPVIVFGLWKLVERLATTEQMRQENSAMLLDAIRVNLLTDQFGRNLNTSALVMFATMMIGVLATVWRLRDRFWGVANNELAEATLALFVCGFGLWFAFLSVGWPRYAFAGWVIGQLLFGKLLWDLFQAVCRWGRRHRLKMTQSAYGVAIGGLAVIALIGNLYPVLRFEQDDNAQQMADYIAANVPREAVIESWAWELDALGPHWEYHHPHQRYLFLAIRQMFHERQPFNLDYELLQADPDYLVAGPFSDWTQIYKPEAVEANFVELAEIGAYRIYQRVR